MQHPALKELASTPTGTVHDFLDIVRDVLKGDDVQVANVTKLESKLSAAGYVFLGTLLSAPKSVLEEALSCPPAVSTVWLTTIEEMAGFRFSTGTSPPQILADTTTATPGTHKKCGRGGNRQHKLSSPIYGTEPLGAWLRAHGQLKQVVDFFSQVGIYHTLFDLHRDRVFLGLPIVVKRDGTTINALTTAIVKVSVFARALHGPSLSSAHLSLVQATASRFGYLNIDRVYAQHVLIGMSMAKVPGAPDKVRLRFLKDSSAGSYDVESAIRNRFHAIKKETRSGIKMASVYGIFPHTISESLTHMCCACA